MNDTENSFKERLLIEYNELSERIGKLRLFICSEKFDTLPEIERNELRKQFRYMEKYQLVLIARASRLCVDA